MTKVTTKEFFGLHKGTRQLLLHWEQASFCVHDLGLEANMVATKKFHTQLLGAHEA